jgi:hypothetical protein
MHLFASLNTNSIITIEKSIVQSVRQFKLHTVLFEKVEFEYFYK